MLSLISAAAVHVVWTRMEFGSLSKRPLHVSPRRRLLLLPCAFKATKDMNTADPDQLHGRLPAYLLLPSLHPSQLRKNLGFWEGAYVIEEVKEVQGKLVHLMTTSLLSRPASPQKPWTSHGGILARDRCWNLEGHQKLFFKLLDNTCATLVSGIANPIK